ncbi:MAG: hypothetical protein V3U54_07890 [Thermodesulfobacteriota bacterium]
MKKLISMTVDIEFGLPVVLLKKGDIIEVEPHKSIPNAYHVFFNDKRTESELLLNEPAIFERVNEAAA